MHQRIHHLKGENPHQTWDFKGSRVVVIAFIHKNCQNATDEVKSLLENDYGFPLPPTELTERLRAENKDLPSEEVRKEKAIKYLTKNDALFKRPNERDEKGAVRLMEYIQVDDSDSDSDSDSDGAQDLSFDGIPDFDFH